MADYPTSFARRSHYRLATAIVLLVSANPIVAAGQAPGDAGQPLALALPGLRWVLELRVPDFVIARDETRPGGDYRYVYALNEATDIVLPVRLERSGAGRTPAGCRDAAWGALGARSPFRMTDVQTTEVGPLAILEYMVHEYQGVAVGQRHVHAYFGREDVCAEVHLSKIRFAPADSALFDEIIRSVMIRPRATL